MLKRNSGLEANSLQPGETSANMQYEFPATAQPKHQKGLWLTEFGPPLKMYEHCNQDSDSLGFLGP